MIMKRQDIVVGGVLKIGAKALVIKRSLHDQSSVGYWEVPKGGVEFGEDPETALKREFFEEVNLKIELGDVNKIYSHTYSRDGVDVHFWEIDFLVQLSPGESLDNVRLSRDHDDWRMVNKEEAATLEPMYEDRKANLLSLFKS